MKTANAIIEFLKFVCGLSAIKMFMMLVFLSLIVFFTFEYLILDKDSKMLPENFHPKEEQEETIKQGENHGENNIQ